VEETISPQRARGGTSHEQKTDKGNLEVLSVGSSEISLLYNLGMFSDDILRKNRQQILALAKKYGAYNVRVFGSLARGEARPDSDIDFLVELEAGRSLFDLGGLLFDLEKLLGVEVDVVTEKGLRARLREHILKEAIPL
jgi:hypothetical protein